jgi:hypothetical protein
VKSFKIMTRGLIFFHLLLTTSIFAAPAKVKFNRDVRPILSDKWRSCPAKLM